MTYIAMTGVCSEIRTKHSTQSEHNVHGTRKPKHIAELISTIKTAYEHLLDISHRIKKRSVQRPRYHVEFFNIIPV
jgi:hypothetical protein